MNRNEVIKKILFNRTKVNLKLSSIANDLASRGRRHDNSYTDNTELTLMVNMYNATTDESKLHYKEMLDNIHANANDYLPAYHGNDLSKMNMIQLLEFIVDRVSRYETLVSNESCDNSIESYTDYVLKDLEVTDELRGIILNTVEYIIDRNKSIMKNLPKSSNDIIKTKSNEEE